MSDPTRVGILIGHSLTKPLEEAVEMAMSSVNDFRNSGLAIDLWIDTASKKSLIKLASRKIDYLLFYGHGTEDGKLVFVDGDFSWDELSEGPEGEVLWTGFHGVLLMACHSSHFAKSLPCPWVAFGDEILRAAPKGFVHAWVSKLKTETVADALRHAHDAIKPAMTSSFPDELIESEIAWPSVRIEAGSTTIKHGSPALFGREETDIASVEQDGRLYPEHDPFVGRLEELKTLAKLPSRLSDGQLVQRYWVDGDAGMGKSALLRQHACNVRDLAFAEEAEPVWLLHAYCMNCVLPKDLEKVVIKKAVRLYALPKEPESISQLFKMLKGVPGVHVWVLDDLTYLRPEIGMEQHSTHTATMFAEAAKVNAIAIQFVISARFAGSLEWTPLQTKELTRDEAINLANRIRIQEVRRTNDEDHVITDSGMTLNEVRDAAQLFDRCGRSTVHFKRALNLATLQQISLREMASQLVGYADGDTEAFSLRMVQWELEQLDNLSHRDGFHYRAFLHHYWNIIYRLGTFAFEELRSWFPTDFFVQSSGITADRAYRRGLVQLVRLGFIATRKESDQEIFYLPPNQRVVMESLASEDEIPSSVPFRAPMANLSMALERVNKGEFESIQSILAIERDYAPYIANLDVANAVLTAGLIRAEVAGFSDTNAQISIYNELIGRYGERDELALSELVTKALFNKGNTLGQLGQSAEAIGAYDELIGRYGEREELVLAKQVAQALLNKGLKLEQLGKSAEAIGVFDELIGGYGERDELALAVQVAKALVAKSAALASKHRFEEALEVLNELESRYAVRGEEEIQQPLAYAKQLRELILQVLKQADKKSNN